MFLQKRIHEWSQECPAWQRDLLRRLAGGPLGDGDRAEVIAILLSEEAAPAPVPLELSDLPLDEGERGRVELRSIGAFRNVNRLAEGQLLRLEPGLNVVFGKNASGKSGHGRLLRSVCRAAEREPILPNVFELEAASQPQTAEIVIDVDGAEQVIAVDLDDAPDRLLSAISVFDTSCARVYLTKPNVITYVPRPLLLLKQLADEQDVLAAELRRQAGELRRTLPTLPEIDSQTNAGAAVASLHASSDPQALGKLATLDESELAELEELETIAATIRADTSRELAAAARTRASGARAALQQIRGSAALVNENAVAKLAGVCHELQTVTTAERELADRAFADQRFPGTGQEAWLELWATAKRFAESGGGEFPTSADDPACPLCQQDLDAAAQERIATFEEFVRSDLRERVATLDRERARLLQALPDAAALRAALEGNLRDAPADILTASDGAVATIETQVEQMRALATGTAWKPARSAATADITLIERYAETQTQLGEAHAALRDDEKQREVLQRLAELKARQALQAALPRIEARLETLRAAAEREAAASELNTQRVSVQLRKLQEATVTERLRSAIREELEGLMPDDKRVELVGQASKGETVIQLRLADPCHAKVEQVLSTGEQAAVATAFFLAELAVGEEGSGVVLDDPVSSLDHDHREYLAGRLVSEARKRQVVIYSHDLTFLYYLQEAAEEAGIDMHGQTLERSDTRVGVVRDELPTKTVSPSHRRKMLRHRLRFELTPLHEKKDPAYEAKADQWVVDLRKGYDQMIEDYLLGGVVRRNNQQVRVRNLFKVKWTPELAKRIEREMKKLSTKAHHESLDLYPRPHTPAELQTLLAAFEAICTETAPREEKESEAEEAIPDTLFAEAQAAAQP